MGAITTLLYVALLGRFCNGFSIREDTLARDESGTAKAGEAVFLSPLIKEGRLDEAKSLCKVGELPADFQVPSYAGYITVNPEFNSNLFFWFVPSMSDPENAPVLLWLQGGPGTTSLLGFFSEHGPYRVSADGTRAEFRELTWAQRYSMLYVDQPVGAGFSFTESEAGYARNITDVGRDMFEFLQQFFTLFGELAENEFYMSGESYAGKYVPAIGAAIHENSLSMKVNFNFKGIAYGNGLTDPVNMLDFGEFLYGIGLIDRVTADYMTRIADEAIQNIHSGRTDLARGILDSLFFGMATNVTYFENVTGFEFYYNYLYDKEPKDIRFYKQFVVRPEIRRAINVGQREFATTRDVVYSHFAEDFVRSAVPQLTVLLENGYRVLIYSGPLDICVPTTQSEKFLSRMAWSRASRWAHAPQSIWRSAQGGKLLGYKKTVDNLSFVVVLNSGHMVPYDQPEAAFELITSFIDATSPFEA